MHDQPKQMLDKLMAPETHFHILVEAVPVGIYLTNAQGDCIYVNPYWSAMAGLSREEAAGRGWVRGLHPDDRAHVAAQWYKVVGSTEPWVLDYRFQTAEGKVTWVSGRAVALHDEAGRITGYLGVNVDITAEREAQQLLAASEVRYRRIVETANVGIWQTDAAFCTTHVNPVMTEMLGYTKEEMAGRPVTDFVHPDDLEDHYRRITQRQQGYHDRYGRRLLRKDGSVCFTEVSATALQDTDGHFAGSLAMFMDVSVLHRSMEELALLNQAGRAFSSSLDLDEVLLSVLNETRHLLNVAATSIWLREADTGDLVCRQATGPQSETLPGWRIPAGEGIAGRTSMTAQSQIVADVWHDPRHYDSVSSSTQVPIRALLSVPVIGKQGVLGVIEAVDVQANRFTAADQRLLESLAATAALAIENAHLYAQTQQEAQHKSQLLSELNHRVGNTLNIIQSLIEFEQAYAPPKDTAAYGRLGNAMRQRVQGFAEIHKLLATLTQWGPLPVPALVQMLSDGVMRSLPEARVAIHTCCADVLITPKQASYLALVLNELLTNALKYALPAQGTLHIEIEAEEDGQHLHVRCRDDGPGYPEEVLRGARTDVGLHLVRAFVEGQLEGTLHLSNTPGATADLRFPIKR
jgi:PAS domain S-box-containing protein